MLRTSTVEAGDLARRIVAKGEFVRRMVILTVLAVVVSALGAGSATAATAFVTKSTDSGLGSFRAAIDSANANSNVDRIVFRFGLAPVMLASPVEYNGTQSLDILGNGAVLDGNGFVADTPGNLSVSFLTFRDAPGEGLTYLVPSDATGTKKIVLIGVKALDNDGHGVLIRDQEFPQFPDTDPPTHPMPDGSDASLDVKVVGSHFEGNGNGESDRDGLRVDEGGLGNLNAVISLAKVEGTGGDGIELDERGDGDVVFNVSASEVEENGSRDPDDLEDGLDVDEWDAGSVIGKVIASSFDDNFEECIDLNENDAGDFKVDLTAVSASNCGEEGVDFEEDDDFAGGGDLVATLIGVKANGNGAGGDAGLKIREKGDGNLDATVRNAQANGNEADGIQIREDALGNLVATVDRSEANNNLGGDESDGNGVNFDENSDGELNATLSRSNSGGNAAAGVRADEGGAGGATSALTLLMTTFIPANLGADGDVDSSVPVA
jgi:hypothetical protein